MLKSGHTDVSTGHQLVPSLYRQSVGHFIKLQRCQGCGLFFGTIADISFLNGNSMSRAGLVGFIGYGDLWGSETTI